MTTTTPAVLPEAARARLLAARRALVLSGAGLSVASGLPTYRGATSSLYADPAQLRLAFASTLRRDPGATWRGFVELRRGALDVAPNAGHRAIAAYEQGPREVLIATQNVDGLHQRAGARAVVELHGSLRRARCLDEACPAAPWELAGDAPDAPPPPCPWCGGPARPDVVLFGEGDDARWAPVRAFLARPVDVVLLVGTSGTVPVPAEVVRLARAAGPAWVLDLNPSPSIGEADAALAARAEDALPALLA